MPRRELPLHWFPLCGRYPVIQSKVAIVRYLSARHSTHSSAMSRSPVTVTVTITGTGTGTSRTSSALPQPQEQAPQQQLLAPSSATQQTQTRRRSSAAISADQLQLLGFGPMPQKNMGLARGPDESPSTSPSALGSRRNSQAFLRLQSVPSIGPLSPDPNDLFMRVKFDGTLVHLTHVTHVLTQPHDQIRRSA